MATMPENLLTISKAVYGKEMRPAIVDALSQSWDKVKTMMDSVDKLNERLDSLPDGGGDNPDVPSSGSCTVAGSLAFIVKGAYTPACYAGMAEEL